MFASLVTKSRRWFRGRARVTAVVVVVGVAILIAVAALSGSDGPAVSPTVVSTTSAQIGTTGGSLASVAGSIVTVAGTINKILPNGDLVVNDGHVDYTIALSATAKVVDLAGADVARDLLQVGTSVQVTGPLTDSTITVEKVLVPTPTPPESAPTTS